MPALKTPTGKAESIPEKAQALFTQFYPKVVADLSDINDTTFADHTLDNPLTSDTKATLVEVRQAIRRMRSGKALGADGIATDFLKAIGKLLVIAIVDLLTAS